MAMIYQPDPVLVVEPTPVYMQPTVYHSPPTLVLESPPPPVVIHSPPPPVVIHSPPPPQVVVHSPPAVTVVQQSGPVVIQPRLRDTPGRLKCSYCQQEVVTVTRGVNGACTWTVFGTLCFFLIWPFCLIPFCVNSCKDIEHSCPNCHNIIYIYRRM